MRMLWIMLFAVVSVFADAQPYFGLGGISSTEHFSVKNPGTTERDGSAAFNAVQIKAGYGDIKAYAVEIDLGYGRYDKNIFSTKDTDYLYFDIGLIKAFDFDVGFFPFFKLGFGVGELEVERPFENSMSSGSFFAGLGLFWPLGWGFDLEASATYRDKSWEGLDMIGAEVESASRIIEPYLGVNLRF